MRLRTMMCAVVFATLLASPMGLATATATPTPLEKLAQQQTNLLLKFYEGQQNVSPAECGVGQGPGGVDGVFLLPVLSFTPGNQTINCTTTARSVLVDFGGFALGEDDRFPSSSYPLNGDDEPAVPFTRENLEPICDDIIHQKLLGAPSPATLDNGPIAARPQLLNSELFTAEVNRKANIPGDADLYADSVDLGHPGLLATVFCGFKAKVALGPGTHTIVVDYSGRFGTHRTTVFTYNITVNA
jgi:hypothetical protein